MVGSGRIGSGTERLAGPTRFDSRQVEWDAGAPSNQPISFNLAFAGDDRKSAGEDGGGEMKEPLLENEIL